MARIFGLTALAVVLVVAGCNQTDKPDAPPVPSVGILTCEDGGEGCTPGYWKNIEMHGCEWVTYSTTDDFDTVFGTNYFNPDRTLLEALQTGGGGYDALGRHAVAALLSAASHDVDYPLSVSQVKSAVRAGNKSLLSGYNELGCPLNNCK